MEEYSSGEWLVKAGREEEFVQTWREFADAASQGPDDWATLLRDRGNPRHFRSVGLWRDSEQAVAWRASDRFKSGMESLRELLESGGVELFDEATHVGGEVRAGAIGR